MEAQVLGFAPDSPRRVLWLMGCWGKEMKRLMQTCIQSDLLTWAPWSQPTAKPGVQGLFHIVLTSE